MKNIPLSALLLFPTLLTNNLSALTMSDPITLSGSGCIGTTSADFDKDGRIEYTGVSIGNSFKIYDWNPDTDSFDLYDVLPPPEVNQRQNRYGGDLAAADINGDGWVDIIVPASNNSNGAGSVAWFENPGGNLSGTWVEHSIHTWSGSGSDSVEHMSEVAAGDINGDGRIDVVTRDVSHGCFVFYQNSDGSGWEDMVFIPTNPREGLTLFNPDGDLDLDIVINGLWFETPADPLTGSYTSHIINNDWYPATNDGGSKLNYACQVEVGDFNGDNREDVIITNAEELGTSAEKPKGINLFIAPADPISGTWTKVVLRNDYLAWHSCELGDVDSDGDLDVISGISPVGTGGGAPKQLIAFLNDGSGTAFTQQVFSTTLTMYQASLGDADGDGDPDLFAPNNWSSGENRYFENVTPPVGPPPGFVLEEVLNDLEQPISMRFLPDGRIILLHKTGDVRIIDVQSIPAQSEIYMNIRNAPDQLNSGQERGLLDLAIDPDFPTSPYVYLLYTPKNVTRMRVSRFTHLENAGGLSSRGELSSEVILWEDTDNYAACCHYGGGLDFGPDGNIWLTTGDHFQGTYATSLSRAGGKVHRFAKDGSIPTNNPYFDGTGPNVDSIMAYALRNPFRARWDLPSGRLFIAEVGGNEQNKSWEDLHVMQWDSSSSRIIDNDFGTDSDDGVFSGINFGWPSVEGSPPHLDFPSYNIDTIGEPWFAYSHSGNTSAINGGIVYRGTQFPDKYQGAYFYSDSTRDFVRYLRFDTDGKILSNPAPDPVSIKNPDNISHTFDLTSVGRIVSLEEGPDGALYYISITDAGGFYGSGNINDQAGALRRYVFEAGNQRPVIPSFIANPNSGSAPLNVDFMITASDPDNSPISYRVLFGDGQDSGNFQPLTPNSPLLVEHRYLSDGVYEATIIVSDDIATSTKSVEISVGSAPLITSLTASNDRSGSKEGMFQYGDTITFSASATDAEDGTLAGAQYSFSVAFIRPGNIHPSLGPVTGSTSIEFPIPNQGQGFSGPVYYLCTVTVTDSSGLKTSATTEIYPEQVNISFDTVPSGIPIQVDGNAEITTPFVQQTLINFPHTVSTHAEVCLGGSGYGFTDWSGGSTDLPLTYLVPETDSSLTAHYSYIDLCDETPSGLITDGLVLQLESDLNVSTGGDDLVTGWLDQSGLGNDLVATGDPRLALNATPTGMPALVFDGSGDSLVRVHATDPLGGLPMGNNDRTVLLVGQYHAASAWAGLAYGTGTNNQTFGVVVRSSSSGSLTLQGWGSGNDLASTVNGYTSGWIIQTGVLASGTGTLYANGQQIAQWAHTYNTTPGILQIARETANSGYATMDVAAALIYDRALSATELEQIESYLRNRYLVSLPGLSVSNASASEDGDKIRFTLQLTAASDSDIFVTYSTVDETATAGSDYTAASHNLALIPASTTSIFVDIPILDDFAFETDEHFTLTLSNPSNATLITATATGTILDNDSRAYTAYANSYGLATGQNQDEDMGGSSNEVEFWLGSDPTDSLDDLLLSITPLAEDSIRLEISELRPFVNYHIHYHEDLNGAINDLESRIFSITPAEIQAMNPEDRTLFQLQYDSSTFNGFYQISIEPVFLK